MAETNPVTPAEQTWCLKPRISVIRHSSDIHQTFIRHSSDIQNMEELEELEELERSTQLSKGISYSHLNPRSCVHIGAKSTVGCRQGQFRGQIAHPRHQDRSIHLAGQLRLAIPWRRTGANDGVQVVSHAHGGDESFQDIEGTFLWPHGFHGFWWFLGSKPCFFGGFHVFLKIWCGKNGRWIKTCPWLDYNIYI